MIMFKLTFLTAYVASPMLGLRAQHNLLLTLRQEQEKTHKNKGWMILIWHHLSPIFFAFESYELFSPGVLHPR